EIEEANQVVASATKQVSGHEPVREALTGISNQLGTDVEQLLSAISQGKRFKAEATVVDVIAHEASIRLKRVRIDIHFESEDRDHRFFASQTWEDVHKWACQHFNISTDACPNLELREGSPKGPALND